jgi:toxin ParE1/3/4
MATVRYSVRAKGDLLSIGKYTLHAWGEAQAGRYLAALEDCARMLARNATIGRSCNWIRTGLRRFEIGKHVLFYRRLPDCIFVTRILHQSMMPDQHSFEDEGPGE